MTGSAKQSRKVSIEAVWIASSLTLLAIAAWLPRVLKTQFMSSDSIDPDPPRPVAPAETTLSRRVDLTTLWLFIAICEEQNLTKAANREGVAASAVSKRMNDFEQSFGVTLFKRLSKGIWC